MAVDGSFWYICRFLPNVRSLSPIVANLSDEISPTVTLLNSKDVKRFKRPFKNELSKSLDNINR